jgi:hypothetical protein
MAVSSFFWDYAFDKQYRWRVPIFGGARTVSVRSTNYLSKMLGIFRHLLVWRPAASRDGSRSGRNGNYCLSKA